MEKQVMKLKLLILINKLLTKEIQRKIILVFAILITEREGDLALN
jgi:hypothetical protein